MSARIGTAVTIGVISTVCLPCGLGLGIAEAYYGDSFYQYIQKSATGR